MLFITIFFPFFSFTSYHTLLHNAGAHFHVILNDLMIHITYISTKKKNNAIYYNFFFKWLPHAVT